MPDGSVTIRQARRNAASRLAAVRETADLDAELLLRAVLGVDRTGLFMREPDSLAEDDAEKLEALLQRRLLGEPIAYILHRAPFRNLVLYVDERVLIPRPETEDLVRIALGWLAERPGPRRVIDVGTGSGAIALSLASELGIRADVEIVATDISADALHVAAINRERLGLTGRVRLIHADLLERVEERFDLVLANLPYLRPDQRHPSTAHEPELALYADEDGFGLHRRLIQQLPAVLNEDGALIAEIDPEQAGIGLAEIERVLSRPANVVKDASGRERFLIGGRGA